MTRFWLPRGAVLLIEKLVPAIEHIDSSSGTLGTAVNKALDDLAGIIAGAEVSLKPGMSIP